MSGLNKDVYTLRFSQYFQTDICANSKQPFRIKPSRCSSAPIADSLWFRLLMSPQTPEHAGTSGRVGREGASGVGVAGACNHVILKIKNMCYQLNLNFRGITNTVFV